MADLAVTNEVVVLATGGTIAGVHEDRSAVTGYKAGVVGADDLLRAVREELARPSVHGVVITHGTDTMEESAYLLDLVLDTEKPVVFVGAMRPSTAYSADGPANLLNAVRVAASPKTVGLGVLVMMDDAIHCPRFVTKLNTVHTDAFFAGENAAIGSVSGGKVFVNMKPAL